MLNMFSKEGCEYVFGSTDLALKSARIVDFCGKSSGFADLKTQWIVDQL